MNHEEANFETMRVRQQAPGTGSEIDTQALGTTAATPDKDEIKYPDGGRNAYLAVIGSFFGSVTCLGLVNAIGSVQAYVSSHQLSGMTTFSISWIFSIYLSLSYALGLAIGPIFDHHGSQAILVFTTVFVFAGLMGAASSTQMYQFVLSFVSLGIGNGAGMTPVVGVINHWFLRKRGLMTGVVTCGGSVGGLTFPLLLRFAYDKYGYEWAMRILAFINLGCMLVSVILCKERIIRPPTSKFGKRINVEQMLQKVVAVLKRNNDKTFWLTMMASFFAELSLVLVVTYFVTYAMAQGVPESTAYLLSTIWAAASIPGRILPGFASDYLGKFNVHIFMLSGLNVCFFGIWYAFGHKLSVLYVFACVAGFFQGSTSGMIPACLAQITRVSEFGERFGILNFCLSFGNLLGVPIGAAIIRRGSVEEYDNFVLLVGGLGVASVVLYVLARYTLVGVRMNVKI
ncbi:hypothetical protein PSN45_005098 [Yamadazyma tenuis]|uniref:MFS general substrate transporter n=1 Tax=Candida tenuis (strain ATCC 10573 / BCRC 21748 / CBS 615 / JCM 9827 / NBRC 10315 / NRRL Y-1498 / VKM Y-70) TaxID=590646 RepID=G3B2S9_CANTC|nr:uncharacterized protein CANTEDRAFT_113530 [Yamadazyma tenuis ATCC 10573]XP_006685926.1 MFS general substrate transporter [Yamadazyma tenuis ATCC 10573]EGV65119.1 hypothetical protein CANTEDRAFT_113530 [Yamadazyma tenuis ATCC 10573]EGV65120.1 MFS general substrate transporter [Yamadazyma tenuis ATCC 10573]WEJ97543.1 hypothetical protein PSN45_005098 [Yamadazyma tenuis]